jgi:hypothetical protein
MSARFFAQNSVKKRRTWLWKAISGSPSLTTKMTEPLGIQSKSLFHDCIEQKKRYHQLQKSHFELVAVHTASTVIGDASRTSKDVSQAAISAPVHNDIACEFDKAVDDEYIDFYLADYAGHEFHEVERLRESYNFIVIENILPSRVVCVAVFACINRTLKSRCGTTFNVSDYSPEFAQL